VKAAINAPLPPGWEEYLDEQGDAAFRNAKLKKDQTEHPLDPYFSELVIRQRTGVALPRVPGAPKPREPTPPPKPPTPPSAPSATEPPSQPSPGVVEQIPMATVLPFSAEVAAGLKPAPTSVGSTATGAAAAAGDGGPMDVMSMMQDAERRMRKDMEAQVRTCVRVGRSSGWKHLLDEYSECEGGREPGCQAVCIGRLDHVRDAHCISAGETHSA